MIDGFAQWANENMGSLQEFNLYADSDIDSLNGLGSLLGTFTVSGPALLSTADISAFAPELAQFLQIETIAPTNRTVGIGEIAFRTAGAAPVPEPAALGLIGAGIVGLALA